MAVGQQYTSPASGYQRIEQDNANITYVGTWTKNVSNASDSSGTHSYATVTNAQFQFNFTKQKLRILGIIVPSGYGSATIYIDGVSAGTIDYNIGTTQYQTSVFEISNLSDTEHSVNIIANSSANINIDAIDIDSAGQIKAYNPPAIVGQPLVNPSIGWTRYEETNTKFLFTGTWSSQSNASYSGGTSKYSTTVGANIKFAFTGTKFRIIGLIQPTSGGNGCESITVNIDGSDVGTFAQNTSTSGYVYKGLCYDATGLSNTNHVVTLTYAGTGGSKQFILDCIDLESTSALNPMIGTQLTAPDTGWTRINETNTNFTFVGSWTNGSGYSSYNNDFKYSDSTNAEVRFNIVGSRMRIITFQTYVSANANNIAVYIDGVKQGTFNEYVGNSQILGQMFLFECAMSYGEHYVSVKVEGTAGRMYFDALDYIGDMIKPYDTSAGQRVKNLVLNNMNNSSSNTTIKWISLRLLAPVSILACRIIVYDASNRSSYDICNIKEVELYYGATKVSANGASPNFTPTATSSYGGSYLPAKMLDASVSTSYLDNWFSAAPFAPDQRVMFKRATEVTIDKIRLSSHDSYGNRGILKTFEVQFTKDSTALISDPYNSSKWFSIELLNGNLDGSEKTYADDTNTNPATITYGYVAGIITFKYLIQDGTDLKYINGSNLVTVCSITDDNSTIENAFKSYGLNNFSGWTDSLKNQITNSTFKILAYK